MKIDVDEVTWTLMNKSKCEVNINLCNWNDKFGLVISS